MQGKVAVAEDDGVGGWEAATQASKPALHGPGVMDYRDGSSADLDLRLGGKQVPQRLLVDIAVHGMDGGTDLFHVLQRRAGEEVTGVNDRVRRRDQVDAALGQPTVAPRHVGVGEYGNHIGKF